MTGFRIPLLAAAVAFGMIAFPLSAGANQGETSMANAPTKQERNKALVQDRFTAWANGTGNPFELLDDNVTWTITGRSAASKTYPNKEAFLVEVIRPFNARMQAPLKPTVHGIYADGNTVVIFFDARTIAKDGKPYINTYTWYLDMRDGKVVRATAMFDSIEFNELWSRVQPTP